jgi:dipeptidyl aminopeptidase/acylaminoacyl peptidase
MRCSYFLALFLAGLISGCNLVQTTSVQDLHLSSSGTAVQFFYESLGGKVEGYLVRPAGDGPFPLMILLHGHTWMRDGARRLIPVAQLFSSDLCYASLALSLPGYGKTEVAGDDDKEAATRVLLDGISKASQLPWVDRDRLMLYGFSRGAVFAAALAGKVRGLRGLVLHSGAYDIGRLYKETESAWVRRSISPNGDSDPALFSVLPEVSQWTAPTLILHGARDQIVPVNQAFLLRDQLKTLGKAYHLVLFPDAGHRLPLHGVKEAVLSFLTQQVGTGCER